jgi:hypothetical protein
MLKRVIPAEALSNFRGKIWAALKIRSSIKMKQAIKELHNMKI